MAKKTIYLIRHGQTEYNRKRIHQYPAVPLSEVGHKQAKEMAARVAEFGIDTLISSDITRARETAEHVAKATGKEIEFSSLFQEIIRPSEISGKHFFDPRSIWVFILLYLHAANGKWHHHDEENFSEFRERAHKAIEFLEVHDGKNIAVVTHRIFIGAILGELECKFACSMGTFIRKSITLGHIPNTAIIKLTYDPDRDDPWRIEK